MCIRCTEEAEPEAEANPWKAASDLLKGQKLVMYRPKALSAPAASWTEGHYM